MNRPNHEPIRLLGLFIFALALHLCGTWILPLIDRDEPRFAEAAREMRERGDLVIPTFNNEPRYDKPPLTYWCQILFYKVFGENDFAARFHSAFAASLTSLVIFGFCARLHDTRTAWRAAIAFTLCLQTFVHARAAVADMLMVMFFTIAIWAGWELCEQSKIENQKSKIPWWWIFYVAIALGFYAKGPIAFLPVCAVLIFAKLNRVERIHETLKLGRGLVLALAIISVWGIPALVRTHGEFLQIGIGRHVIARSFEPLEGHGGRGLVAYLALLPFYFVTIFASFFPWSIWLPWTVRALKNRRSAQELYLLCGILPVFLVFTLVATKLPHYTLPAFPLIACIAAPHLLRRFFGWSVAMVCIHLGFAFIFFPIAANYLPSKQLVEKCAPMLKPDMEFASVEYDEPSLVWYFRKRLKTWHRTLHADEIGDYMNQPGPRLCIMPAAVSVDPNWKIVIASGINIAKGKRVDLTATVKQE